MSSTLFSLNRKFSRAKEKLYDWIGWILTAVFRCFPIQKDKVIGNAFSGMAYSDNAKYIMEELRGHGLDLVWMQRDRYPLPEGIRGVNYHNVFRRYYEYMTAAVWIHSHHFPLRIPKRPGQILIETWHGGLGIKKIELDSELYSFRDDVKNYTHNTAAIADYFISNSDFLSRIYRSAFQYNGEILQTGLPKNDILIRAPAEPVERVRMLYSISPEDRILLYAPTYRDEKGNNPVYLNHVYAMDIPLVLETLKERFGGHWTVMVRLHPSLKNVPGIHIRTLPGVIDATAYPDMQELLLAADVMISDYSSSLFDAALREIPCFIYARDFESFHMGRGTYFMMEELPFSYAKDTTQLIQNIQSYHKELFLRDWYQFGKKTGLYESGYAAKEISQIIMEYVKGAPAPTFL